MVHRKAVQTNQGLAVVSDQVEMPSTCFFDFKNFKVRTRAPTFCCERGIAHILPRPSSERRHHPLDRPAGEHHDCDSSLEPPRGPRPPPPGSADRPH